MSKPILRRHVPLCLKTILPIVLFLFLWIAGCPISAYSSAQEADTVKGGQGAAAASAGKPQANTDSVKPASETVTATAKNTEQKKETFTDEPTHKNVQRGERFFMGFLPFDREYPSCVSCHNITASDTLNWNPSAMDIALKYVNKDYTAFAKAILQPGGAKMTASHQNIRIEENDLKTVKMYLDELAVKGPPNMGPTVTRLMLFIGLGLLITLALLDLIFFHKIKYRVIPLLVLLIALGVQFKMVSQAAVDLGRTPDYAPDQPIKFSHKIHAGDNQIDCKYCHHTAEYSKSAGIPSANLCMNCHIIVREGSHSGRFEITKVLEANETKTPIEWVRIHNLPDHVMFSHAQHVGIGKVDCKQCHGPVEEMDIMRQHSDLSMGWCINCHRETAVNFKDNAFYDNYLKLHEMLKSGELDTVRAADVGANDCMRCHY